MSSPPAEDICFRPATALARLIRSGDLSARDVLEAHLQQIARTNPAVNAIVTLLEEDARRAAAEADAAFARHEPLGPLHGLPIAHKDLVLTAGIRTTFGSPIFAEFVPEEDELFVSRVRSAGAILVGKTNTPEFGAGSHTFNDVFGSTRNPYDLRRTAGGSSGGAAAALACGMVPIADGSDHAASVRNPASYCNVVGFRPSPGRVPSWPSSDPWQDVSVDGAMGRTVEDAALLLSVIAGPDPRVPIALPEPGSIFAPPLGREIDGARVAWAPTCGGTMPVDPAIARVIDASRAVFDSLGLPTEDAFPDLSGARTAFLTLRARLFASDLGTLLDEHRDRMKATVIWNIEEGRKVGIADLDEATRLRTALYVRVADFFARYRFIVMPVAQVPPFDIELEYPTEVAGQPMETYIDWMESCWCISIAGLPAISVPCGFTDDGLPVGLQIVGRRWDDLGVLQLARLLEEATGTGLRRPPITVAATDVRRVPYVGSEDDAPHLRPDN